MKQMDNQEQVYNYKQHNRDGEDKYKLPKIQ